MRHAIYDAAIVTITTYTVQRGGPAIDACELARQAAHGPLCRHFRTESKYVRITADALTAANRHARHGRRVRRVVNAARWLAGRLPRKSIKASNDSMSVHSLGVPWEDDMTDWQPDN